MPHILPLYPRLNKPESRNALETQLAIAELEARARRSDVVTVSADFTWHIVALLRQKSEV